MKVFKKYIETRKDVLGWCIKSCVVPLNRFELMIMLLSVDGGGKDGDGNTVQVEKKGSGAGTDTDGELDWISEFVQKREEREMVNKLKVVEYLGMKIILSCRRSGIYKYMMKCDKYSTQKSCNHFPKFINIYFIHLLYCFFLSQDEEMKRKRREERLEMIRHNAQLKYAMKRKVSLCIISDAGCDIR